MKDVFKRIIICSMLILSFAFISACGKDNDDELIDNIIPTFESFEIVGANSESLSSRVKNEVITLSSSSEENPFGDSKKTIEEKINEEFEVGESINISYSVELNGHMYAVTKIKNPSNKIITSVTINGQRYTSNSFENSSTNEKIILKLSAGNIASIKSYTLEEINYIDGSSSKNITITGNVEKLIKIGDLSNVTYLINNQSVTQNNISFNFRLTDNDSIISKTNGKVSAVLYDGDNFVKNIEVSTGTQTITFNNLEPGKKYQYALVATYDKLDGNGKKNYVLLKNTVITDGEPISEYTITKANMVNGSIIVANSAKEGDTITIEAIPNAGYELEELYYIEQDSSTRHIINNNQFIMPNVNVTIYATFSEIVQGSGYDITVAEVIGGTFNIVSKAQAGQLVTFTATALTGWELYEVFYVEEGKTIYDYVDIEGNSFVMPESNITIYVVFDISYTISTSSTNGTILVQNKAFEDDFIEIEIVPNSGYKLDYLYYIEDGKSAKHEIEKDYFGYSFFMPSSDITIYATFIEISPEDLYTITVEEVIGGTFDIASSAQEDDWVRFTATPNPGYKLYLLYYIEEGNDLEDAVYFDGDNLTMPASNITIYVFFERAYTINVANIENGEIDIDSLGIEDESIFVEVTPDTGYKLEELYYIKEGTTVKNPIEESFWGLEFDMPASNITIYAIFKEIQSLGNLIIDSKEDLISLSMNEEDWNKNISLTVNIDLGGIEWSPIGNYETPFEGVFNGNGHIISNFKITEELDYVGLFGCVEYGTIKNLNVTNYSYTLDYIGPGGVKYIGGLAAVVNYGNIDKNHSSGAILINGSVSNITIGGLIGEAVDTSIENCYTYGNITGGISGNMMIAGGLIGNMYQDDFLGEYHIQYCYSTMNVSITNINDDPHYFWLSVGGLVGDTYYGIYNSYASGNVSAISNNLPSSSVYYINIGGLVADINRYASVNGYELDTQSIIATESEYTYVNDDATKLTLEGILNKITSSFFGWDDEIWDLTTSSHPTLIR